MTNNLIIRKGISFLLIATLILSGFFITPNYSYAAKTVLSDKTYYHLDMGVQLAYMGSDWASRGYNYGETITPNPTVSFNNDVEAIDTYPLSSSKGSIFDFDGSTSSTNIPSSLKNQAGNYQMAYNNFYSDYVTTSMSAKGSPSTNGKQISFSYSARLNTTEKLDVVNYGAKGWDEQIWQLFGGKNNVSDSNIKSAIENALEQGFNGTAGDNRLYLIFCPTVIEYKKYIEIADLQANLGLPTSAKSGEKFNVFDDSYVDSSLTLDNAIIEHKNKETNSWDIIGEFEGTGNAGENTGGTVEQDFDEIGTETFRLTITATNGQESTDLKNIEITDGREISGVADLVLDEYTYEGHPADADDWSTFEVDGVHYSAKRAYEEKVATNKFRTTGGTIKKDGLTAAIVTYPKKGTYPVTLDITTATGEKLSDTENIEVRKTPYVMDSLGGFQKQNRKQILTLNVAIYPDKPIVDYSIRIKDLVTNEIIDLTKDIPQENGACIKTRPAVMDASGQYWTTITVEFLTKMPRYSDTGLTPRKFSYDAKVTDSKGDSDEVYKEFNVAPDVPPIPAISMQDSFLRGAGTNTAAIEAADASSSDGDQLERTWLAANHDPLTGLAIDQNNALAVIPASSFVNATLLAGYKNLAFGTNQTIGFDKIGVGKTTVKLHVKDIWIEPTLEEYITPSDYLEAETTASTQVINIAPVVSIEPINTLKANIAIMVAKNKLDNVKNQSNAMKADLLQKGIDGNISFIPVAETYNGTLTRESFVTLDGASCLGQSVSTSEYLYVMEAVSVTKTDNSTTANNVKIVAYDKAGKQKWNYAFTEHPPQHRLYVDNQEKYLLCSGTKLDGKAFTLIFTAKTGALLTTFDNVSIPSDSKVFLSSDEKRIYIFNSVGIQKIDFKTGKYTTVLTGALYVPRLTGGKVGYVAKMADMRYYLGKFDMSTESADKLALPTLDFYNDQMANTDGTSWVTPIDWSNDGKVLIARRLYADYYGANGGQSWVLDAKTQKQCFSSIPVGEDKGWNTFLVKDTNGNADYFTIAYGYKGTSQYYSVFSIYKINEGAAESITSWNSGKQGQVKIPNAGYYENGKITLLGEEYYGKCWVYNLTTKTYELADSSISSLGLDPLTGTINRYDGGIISHYYDNGWNGNGSFYYFNRYKVPITSDQSAYRGIIEKADFGDAENYIVNYDLGDMPKVADIATQKNALMVTLENGINSLADKIDEIGKAPQYVLNIIGNGVTNVGSIFKNVILEPNAEYEYAYDLQTVSGTAIDVFKESHTNTIYGAGVTYYKEPIYKADLTNGSNSDITKGFVKYETGDWFNGSHWGYAGYGGGMNSKNGSASGPVISFTMGKAGYIEIKMAGYAERNISIDGKTLYSSMDDKYVLLLPAGSHVLNLGTTNTDNQSVIQNIEIGYLSTSDNSFSGTSVSANIDGIQAVTGKFKAGKEVAYTELQSGVFTSLNLYDMINKGYMQVSEGGMTGYVTISGDGRNATSVFTGRTPNSGKITTKMYVKITAPADKMLWINYGAYHKLLQPSEVFSTTYSSQGYQVYNVTYVSDFYAIELPIGTMGITSASAISFGSTASCVPKYSLKNRNSYFYNVTFPTSTTAKIVKCQSGASEPNSTISFTSESSTALLNALVSNFALKSRYPAYNLLGTYISDDFCSLNGLSLNGWNKSLKGTGSADIKLVEPAEKEEDTPLIYKKGQLIAYNINYSDYENDPSKYGYWIYAHTPYNDGEYPDAAIIYDEDGNIKSVCGQAVTPGSISIDQALSMAKSKGTKSLTAPIDRFYVDGKYIVYHWEYDDTSRGSVIGGYPGYDKVSNTADLTFYVEGSASAPWITGISTSPATVKENNYFSINIGIDDIEKDILNLTTEVYKDKKLIYTHRKKNIYPMDASGNTTTDPTKAVGYPVTNTGALPDKAQAGTYEIVATVRDQTGAGIGSYKFIVVSEGKITGYVNHTDKWDINRKKYNLSWFGNEINAAYTYSEYMALSLPRTRGTNVFWSGEKFMLQAAVAGSPTTVTAKINGYSYSATMSSTGTKNSSGETIYTGSIWDEDMINKWGMDTPEQLTFTFTATYSGGTTKTSTATVIVDNMNPYWKLHRAF
ncbi:hypothetical protein [Clostridium aminobutyricum]|uniref:Uncharacterized protein n=1 Tax=Clostridium aminobutyricum TaxID=33953 RepID=A0A939IJC3_CLOAM|nr:hypothetical protein [Clostridium aminobutyricum]MBN7773429.1 hypothetical protein [Clostridium aminobutyricum]